MSDGPVVCAWGDESIRSVGVARPMYLLGAVIADPAICDEVRAQLLRVPRTGQKLHWRDADEQHHRLIHRAVAPMPVQHVVVVASPADPRRPERARAKCLERMLHELDQRGVGQLIMEARTASLNRRDVMLVDRLRGGRRIPAGIRVEFGLPSTEPMLWLPDQILGMIGDGEAGNTRWLTVSLIEWVTRIDITL